jgi:hypothetical protein
VVGRISARTSAETLRPKSRVSGPKPRQCSWHSLSRSIIDRRRSSGARCRGAGCFRADRPGRRRSSSWRYSTGRLALGALKAFMLLTQAPAGSSTRCPLNQLPQPQSARWQAVLFPCHPHRAPNVYSTPRYFPTPKPCITRQCACDSCALQLLIAASVNDGRSVVRPSQTERTASDADDNRTPLYALPCRFRGSRLSHRSGRCIDRAHLRHACRRRADDQSVRQ